MRRFSGTTLLDGAARYAGNVIFLHAHEQRYDNDADDACGRAEYREIAVEAALFFVDQLEQTQRKRVFSAVVYYSVHENEIAPRRNERRKNRVDDYRFGKRQRNSEKDCGLPGAVEKRGFLHRARNGIEKAFTDIIGKPGAARIHENQREQRIREPHRFQDKIDGDHAHKARKHAENEKHVHDGLPKAEPEP